MTSESIRGEPLEFLNSDSVKVRLVVTVEDGASLLRVVFVLLGPHDIVSSPSKSNSCEPLEFLESESVELRLEVPVEDRLVHLGRWHYPRREDFICGTFPSGATGVPRATARRRSIPPGV